MIRENAFKIFFNEGFSGFSMQKLAKASAVSPATLYIYFKDKDDLIMQLYTEEMQKMTAASLLGFDPAMSFAEGLRLQWLNRARFFLEHPLQTHFLEQARYTSYHDQVMKVMGSQYVTQMKGFVQNAIRNGELVDVSVEVYWSLAFAPLYQLIKFDLHSFTFSGHPRFKLSEKTMMQALELVLKALKP